jgi:hypothetical protein
MLDAYAGRWESLFCVLLIGRVIENLHSGWLQLPVGRQDKKKRIMQPAKGSLREKRGYAVRGCG